MFSDEFLDSLPENPYEAALAMCKKFLLWYNHFCTSSETYSEVYEEFVDAYTAIEAFINATGLPFNKLTFQDSNAQKENAERIAKFLNNLEGELEMRLNDLKFVEAREKYAKRFGGIFLYELSDGDLATIRRLLNELRDKITESELFEAKHKQRILNKLENLQSELHKKMTSLAKLWDLIGDAGIVLGKFGKDAKPLVDRIREIAQITWRTQARAEELPSGTTLPLLSNGKQEDD